MVRCYLAPGDGAKIQNVEAAMNELPKVTELIFAGDFNVNLERTGGWGQDKEIGAVVATGG